jgi:hypothetical protein
MLSVRFAASATWCRAIFHKNRFFAHRSPWASLARLRHRPRSLHLVVSRGDLGAHPRCSDSPPRSKRKAAPRLMFLLAYGRSTCPELASRVDTKVSHDDTVSWKESQQPKRRCFVGSTRKNLRVRKSLRCPPSRRVPDKWSGRRPNKNMGRGSGLSGTKREGVSEQRGWAPKALRLTIQAPKALHRNVRACRGVSR